MCEKHLDDYLPVIAIDVAIEEKTRIAKMAAATLHKLHDAMRQMKDWRDDSAKLKSNIWRMKMALRADDKCDGGSQQQIDPLIVHQKAEIGRLEQANDALENEVADLKRALAKAEEDIARIAACEMGDKIARIEDEFANERDRLGDEILCLKKRLIEESQTSVQLEQLAGRLREFAKGDRAIETVFANAIGRIVETVVSLSEELVTVNDNLYKLKTRNRNQRLKLDRLKAMLRSRCGSGAEYQKRISELNDLAEQLMEEMARLKVIRGNADRGESAADAADIPDIVKHVECLMSDLRNNLRSDREAIIAGGDPDCLKYMKKVVGLKVNLKVLSVELRRSSEPRERSRGKRLDTTALLNESLKEIDAEIGKLKVGPIDRRCRIGGVSGSRYMTKVVELESIVRKSAAAIAVLKQSPSGVTNDEDGNAVEELGGLIERLCRKMGDLELLDDRASLRGRIDQLEAAVARLKLNLLEKSERVDALGDEYASVGLTLARDRKKYEEVVAGLRAENETLRRDARRSEREVSERVAETRLARAEIEAMGKKLRDLRDGKEALSAEARTMREVLRGKDEEVENIITERDALSGILRAEAEGLRAKLRIASDENAKLKSIIVGPGRRAGRPDELKSSGEQEEDRGEDRDNGERSRDRGLGDEFARSKAESNESKISLREAGERIDRPEEAVGDGARPRGEISDVRSNEQSLTYRLNVRTGADEETSRGYAGAAAAAAAADKALASEVKRLRYEKEQLGAELSELRSEKGLLDRSMADADNKCAALQDRVNKSDSECSSLRREMSERAAAAEKLELALGRARAELEDATAEAARLRAENARMAGELDAPSRRRAGSEEPSAERNELAARIDELDVERAGLRVRPNEAAAENEYFSMELNKSGAESDRANAEIARLRAARDAEGLGGIGGKFGDQLEIQRAKYEAARRAAAALYRENNDRPGRLKKMDTGRDVPAMDARGPGFAGGHNEIKRGRDCSDAARTCIKVEIGERPDGGAGQHKVESDTCAGQSGDNKAKIKDRPPKGEPKGPRAENKALKLKRAHLDSESTDVTMELARTKGEFVRAAARTAEVPGDVDGAALAGSVPTRPGIVSIRYEKEISNYSSCPDGGGTAKDKGRPATVGIDQPGVENRTPKMEVDVPRGGLNPGLTDGEKTRADPGRATEEIRALKFELMNLRDEKTALRSWLEMFKGKLSSLESERLALKDELAATRRSNFELRRKANDLRGANEKLKETNAGLVGRLREASEHAAMPETLGRSLKNNFASVLGDNLKEYSSARRNLRTISKRLNRLECVLSKNPGVQPVEENLHVEGQK